MPVVTRENDLRAVWDALGAKSLFEGCPPSRVVPDADLTLPGGKDLALLDMSLSMDRDTFAELILVLMDLLKRMPVFMFGGHDTTKIVVLVSDELSFPEFDSDDYVVIRVDASDRDRLLSRLVELKAAWYWKTYPDLIVRVLDTMPDVSSVVILTDGGLTPDELPGGKQSDPYEVLVTKLVVTGVTRVIVQTVGPLHRTIAKIWMQKILLTGGNAPPLG